MDHWQTLISGIAATLAAAVSVYYLRKQISSADFQETKRRIRRLAAARARLPLSLSDAIHYANTAIQLLKGYLDAATDPDSDRQGAAEISRPVLPEQAILSFEAMIEATDNDEFAGTLASMISEMQVLNSRIGGLIGGEPGIDAMNLQAYLMNAAKVHGYAAGMFPYARLETGDPPKKLSWDSAISALNLNDLYSYDYADLHAFMGRAKTRAEGAVEGS